MNINFEYILIGGNVNKLLITPQIYQFVTVKKICKFKKIRDKLFND